MEYQAYIKNITTNEWVKEEANGKVSHTEDKVEMLVFYDEEDAESTLEYLNDSFADCYVLLVEDDKSKMHHLEEA